LFDAAMNTIERRPAHDARRPTQINSRYG